MASQPRGIVNHDDRLVPTTPVPGSAATGRGSRSDRSWYYDTVMATSEGLTAA